VSEAAAAGVERIVTIGVGRQSSERAVALCEAHTELRAAVGVHPRDAQRRAFSAQIALARETGLPLVIHTRDAAEETLAILADEAAGHPVVLHCFSMPERLDEVVERGYMVSIAGQVTYRGAGDLRAAAAAAPGELLLVETDSPYLAPVPRRGRPNRPANLAHTLSAVAALRGVSEEALDGLTTRNAARVFAW
jgi:TatD DNase family protein